MSSIRDMEEQIEDLQRQIQETRMVLESTPVDGRSGHRRVRDSGISSLLRSVIEEAEEDDTVSVQSSSRQRDRYADKRAKVEDEKERTSGERFDGRTGNDANRLNNKTQRQNKSVLFKPTRYDGTTSWVDYLSHFEMCSIVNEWTEDEKGLYLAVSLSGLAQSVLGDLPSEQRKNFKVLVNALEDRFLPPSQTELYRVQMRERKQRASESLPELGQAIRRLTNLAYPTAPNDVRETLAKEQFLDALAQSDVRLRVKQARPDTLNDAIRLAVELEAYNRAESRTHGSKGYARLANEEASSDVGESKTHESGVSAWMTKMEHMMESLASELKDMKKVKEQSKENKGNACYNCGKQGHFAKDCRVKCKNCGKSGHSTSDCRCPKKCFKCGKEGHIAPQCKENMKDESDKNGKVQGAKGRRRRQSSNISALKEAGMFVETKISGVKARFLIDTGATLTIVSARLYDKLPISSKPSIVESEQDVHSVCGNSLDLKGKAVFELLLGEEIYETEAVVTKLEVDGILGLDFLLGNDCDLRIRRGVLETPSGSVPIQFKGSLGCYRVVAVDTISIPPSSEIVVLGRVCVSDGETIPDMEAVVESNEKSVNRDTALTARTLVRAKEIVPIRLMNVHSEAKVVHSGTTLGELSRAVPVVASVVEDSSRRKEEKELRADIQKLFDEASNNLDENQQNLLRDLLLEYTDSFAASDADLGRTGIIKHKIETQNAKPIKEPPRRVPAHLREEVDENIQDMLRRGIIEPSSSPWASGIVLVRKKDGTHRFCIDYRRLNNVTVKNAYPLKRIDDSLDQLAGNSWFSTLDLCSGYWQVELEKEDKFKTAFASRQGLYQFRVMPFGLCCAAQTFERLMEIVMTGLQWDICLVYLDDIIVFGKTFEEMLNNLRKVLDRLKEAGLKLKAKKCTLCAKRVTFLGHVVSEEGIETDPSKVEAVKDWPVPVSATEVRSFLGLCSYYRKFIKGFSSIARSLHLLTEQGRPFVWTSECQNSFEELKRRLVSAPILAYPDLNKTFTLDTDASNESIGAVLSQQDDMGNEVVISYASRTLSKAERKYCVTRKELLAVVNFVKYFKHYLYGKRFVVRTDHSSLKWLLRFKNPEGQLARWIEVLGEFDMDIQHRPGKLHTNADALSRVPCRQCGYDAELDKHDNEGIQQQVRVIQDKDDQKEKINAFIEDKALLELQKADADLSQVRTWLEAGKRPDIGLIAGKGRVLRSLWAQWKVLEIKDGLLCRKFENESTKEVQHQALVPFSERRKVLFYCHDDKCAAHLGVHKTLSRVRQRYYWPGLQADVRSYIAGCESCSRVKRLQKKNRAPMKIVESSWPMERIATDILGELPTTENGNRYILVVSDYFTKWTESFPMKDMTAATVAQIIVDQVITRFGVPSVIHSDQGVQFESLLFAEMCKILDIKKTRTTPYHPQSDGMVERFNSTLISMLKPFVNEHQRDWDTYIPYVMMAYRACEHETTGQTPNFMMLGREVATPLDIMYEMPSELKFRPANMWAWELKDRMEEAHTAVRRDVTKEMRRQKHYHDTKLSWQKFEPGNDVYVYFPTHKIGCSPKLTSFWRGPYRVLEKCTDVTYKLNCGPRGKPQVIHVDRMRKHRKQELQDENSEEIESISEVNEDDDEQDEADDEFDRTSFDKDEMSSSAETKKLPTQTPEKELGRGFRKRRQPLWLQDFSVK